MIAISGTRIYILDSLNVKLIQGGSLQWFKVMLATLMEN